MKAQVLQARNTISFKEEMESKLSGYKLRQARAFNGKVRQHLSDIVKPESTSDNFVSLYQGFDDTT